MWKVDRPGTCQIGRGIALIALTEYVTILFGMGGQLGIYGLAFWDIHRSGDWSVDRESSRISIYKEINREINWGFNWEILTEKGLVLVASLYEISTDWDINQEISRSIAQESSGIYTDQDIYQKIVKLIRISIRKLWRRRAWCDWPLTLGSQPIRISIKILIDGGCSEISTYQDINVGDQEINLDLDQEIVLKKGLMLTNSPSGIYWEIVTIKLDTTVESSRLSYWWSDKNCV